MFMADFKNLLEYLLEVTVNKQKVHDCLGFPVIVTYLLTYSMVQNPS